MRGAGSDDPEFRRAALTSWACLSLAMLVVAGIYSYLAPFGVWPNRIFGMISWYEYDPGSAYVDAAHELNWGEAPLFVGHPGTTLLVLLSAMQHGYYALASEGGYSFTEFIARNLQTVFLLSKLLMTVLHFVSFWMVFAAARTLLRNERAAFFAALGYATSLPVLYYLSRISVEPLVVIFLLASFLAVWKWQDRALEGRTRSALWFAGLAGAAAVSGALTKLHFLGPLPFFLAFYLLAGSRREDQGDVIGTPLRARALGVFCGSGTVLALVYFQLIDWTAFLRVWNAIATAGNSPNWNPRSLILGPTAHGAFLLCESAFLAMALAGWVAYLLRHPGRRSRTLWLSAFAGWGVLLFAYRVREAGTLLPFHYFHLSNAAAAVFFGYFTELVWRSLPLRKEGWRGAAFGLVWVALIHATTGWVVLDSRRVDAESYRPDRPLHALISSLRREQRVGCFDCTGPILGISTFKMFKLHTMGWHNREPQAGRHRSSQLKLEFESIFVPMNSREVAQTTPKLYVPSLEATIVVLDGPGTERRQE